MLHNADPKENQDGNDQQECPSEPQRKSQYGFIIYHNDIQSSDQASDQNHQEKHIDQGGFFDAQRHQYVGDKKQSAQGIDDHLDQLTPFGIDFRIHTPYKE